MRTYSKLLFAFFFGLIALSSCEEDIDVNLPGSGRKVVIEGKIESGRYAEVLLTRNFPLFSSTAGTSLADALILDAHVYVSDGAVTDTLILQPDSATSLIAVYKGHVLLGVPGMTYHLTVVADGNTYTANTTIPTPFALDSVWWKPEPNQGDSLGYAWAHMRETPGLGNNYRFYAKRPHDRRYLAPFGATFDDKFVDGTSFDFAYGRGYETLPLPPDTLLTYDNDDPVTRGFYFNHDTIYIKFCTIDRASKDFYTTFETALQSNGNPFASPVTILSNVNGGALGVWAGMGVTYDTILPTP